MSCPLLAHHRPDKLLCRSCKRIGRTGAGDAWIVTWQLASSTELLSLWLFLCPFSLVRFETLAIVIALDDGRFLGLLPHTGTRPRKAVVGAGLPGSGFGPPLNGSAAVMHCDVTTNCWHFTKL